MNFLINLLKFLWNFGPIIAIFFFKEVPLKHRFRAALSFLNSWARDCVILPADILAPIIVPIALLFTKREDNKLPWLFRWWDNDVSINGDRAEYQDPAYEGTTYYANAHPRSFKGRYIWLGLRNRASWLSQKLGHKWTDPQDREYWGDPQTGRHHAGWVVCRGENAYQMYVVKKIGNTGKCIRQNFGFKIWPSHDGRTVANVVNIPLSILRYKG